MTEMPEQEAEAFKWWSLDVRSWLVRLLGTSHKSARTDEELQPLWEARMPPEAAARKAAAE